MSGKPMPEFQRWSMAKGSDGKRWSVYMDHDPCGEWVKWADVQQYLFASSLTAAQQQGQVVAWFPTNGKGEIIRNFGDGSPVYASRTKDEAEQVKRCHLGAIGPVVPLYPAPQPSVPEWLNSLRGEALGRLAQDEWMGNRASYPAWGNLSEDERAAWVAVGERIKTAMLAAVPSAKGVGNG